MSKSILMNNDARAKMKEGIDVLANAVKVTLGPKGRNVIIERRNLPHITKDGVTVAKEIELNDPFQNIGAQLVKEVASKTCNDVGDGTTTATILAQAIINQGLERIENGANPILLKKGIDFAVKKIVEYIRENSIDIKTDFEKIKNVATISANNDEELGSLIADAFKKITIDGVIVVEDSKNINTTVEVINGMQFDRGYIAQHFITNPEKNQVELEKVKVLITDLKIITLDPIKDILEEINRRGETLLLIAEGYDNDPFEILKANAIQGSFRSCPIIAPNFGEYRSGELQDIAILTGGTYLSVQDGAELTDLTYDDLGSCEKTITTKNYTTIIGGKGHPNLIDQRVRSLKNSINDVDSEIVIDMIKQRIARLIGGIAVINVGGATEIEMKERRDRVDDAVAATRAAIEEGIVIGGGITYLNVFIYRTVEILSSCNGHKDVMSGINTVLRAIKLPFCTLLLNAGYDDAFINMVIKEKGEITTFDKRSEGFNVATERSCDMIEEGIIDPAKVTRMALENAASIASLFLTTECIIVNENQFTNRVI